MVLAPKIEHTVCRLTYVRTQNRVGHRVKVLYVFTGMTILLLLLSLGNAPTS